MKTVQEYVKRTEVALETLRAEVEGKHELDAAERAFWKTEALACATLAHLAQLGGWKE